MKSWSFLKQNGAELCNLNHIERSSCSEHLQSSGDIYVIALSQHLGIKDVMEWMSKPSLVLVSELCQHRFLFYNNDATQHLFKVSASLDSFVLGVVQILSQVRQFAKAGEGVNGFGRNIGGLFKHAITVGKRVRTETSITSGAVSDSLAAIELAYIKLTEASHYNARMLVIGACKMGKLVIKHLVTKGCKKMVAVNRTAERVAAISKELKDIDHQSSATSESRKSI